MNVPRCFSCIGCEALKAESRLAEACADCIYFKKFQHGAGTKAACATHGRGHIFSTPDIRSKTA